jgi:hypothetical protein
MGGISDGMAEQAGRTYRGATIAWGRGQCYDFDTPNPEVIELEDVAYALAFTVRWRGQTRFRGSRCFYGVGQHCVFGAEEMIAAGHSNRDAFAFLWHEPDEVVLPDFPGPAKACVPEFRAFAKRQGDALRARFGYEVPDPDLVKTIDLRMLTTEKRDLMAGHSADTFHSSARTSIRESEFPPFERELVPYAHPEIAALRWLELYWQLGGA